MCIRDSSMSLLFIVTVLAIRTELEQCSKPSNHHPFSQAICTKKTHLTQSTWQLWLSVTGELGLYSSGSDDSKLRNSGCGLLKSCVAVCGYTTSQSTLLARELEIRSSINTQKDELRQRHIFTKIAECKYAYISPKRGSCDFFILRLLYVCARVYLLLLPGVPDNADIGKFL